MPRETLSDLYVEELKDLYSAECQIVKALPKIIKAATNPELKEAFTDHLEQTKRHVDRLVQVCDLFGVSPKGKKCHGMEGLLEEGAEVIDRELDPAVRDAGLAAAAQHVEHYEMAGYGSVSTWAEQLGYESHVDLLRQTLDEEKEADCLLTEIAERALNPAAESREIEVSPFADVSPRKARSMGRSTTKLAGRSIRRTRTADRGRAEAR